MITSPNKTAWMTYDSGAACEWTGMGSVGTEYGNIYTDGQISFAWISGDHWMYPQVGVCACARTCVLLVCARAPARPCAQVCAHACVLLCVRARLPHTAASLLPCPAPATATARS